MARLRMSAFYLIGLFLLCYCVVESRRYGAIAKTLHMPPLTDSEKWGKKFVVMHTEGTSEDLSDDVDKLLNRFRRTATQSGNGIAQTTAPLNDSHSMLIVHWAGEGSNVIIALAQSSQHPTDGSSRVYLSQDYGRTFQNITTRVYGSMPVGVIDKYYNSDLVNSHYVFTELERKCVMTTRDFARTFTHRCGLPFTPRIVTLNSQNVHHILAFDDQALDSPVYYSTNFGLSWSLMKQNVKSFFWGVLPYDSSRTVYVVEKRGRGGNVVLRSDRYFAEHTQTTVFEGVEDFEIKEEYMFATKRQRLFGSRQNTTLQFWVSYKRGDFVNAQFPGVHGHSDYYVADASEGQVMLCVVHNTSDTNLYVSNREGTRFSLSLERIVYFNPMGANKDTWLSIYYNESFADIHKVAGLRGIYIASQLIASNGSFTLQNQRSLITFDKGGEWSLLTAPTVMHGRSNRNCSKLNNCSLHLSQEFTRLYPGRQIQPLMSLKSAPGLILASGAVGDSLKNQQDMFVSHDAGYSWYQVMEGNYMFSMADHGGVMLAARQFQPTDSVYYSTDEGESWHTFKFTNSAVRLYGILTEPGEKTTVFSVFGSKPDHHSWILFQLNMSGLLPYQCQAEDYKDWSLPDAYPDAGCLLGQKLVVQRRIAHVPCYNGRDFVRMKDLRNCTCTRDDFECDFGYKLSGRLFSHNCVRDDDISDDLIHRVPDHCPPGTFYPYTRGYRLVSGDTCSGGQEHRYAPRKFSCPVRERTEFVVLAYNDSIKSLDLERQQLMNLYQIPSDTYMRITAVAFSYAKNQLFWSTSRRAMIKSLTLNITASDRSTLTVAEGRMAEVSSLAYDWTGDNLYWTDSSESAIEVVRSNGYYRKRLLANHSLVVRPRNLVLDPVHGWMYWLDVAGAFYGRSNVMRAWMSGERSSVGLVTEQPLSLPQGLALDLVHEHLYVTMTSNSSLFRMELDGSNVTAMPVSAQRPGSIDIFKESILWIDGEGRQLMSSSFHSGDVVLKTFRESVIDMVAVSHISQHAKGACTPPTAPCSQLCTSQPHPTDGSQQNRTCKCGDDFVFEQLPDNNEHCGCSGMNEIIIDGYCHTNATNSTCNSDQLMCPSGRCLPSHWRCDGDDDCGDMSDETDCPFYTCPPGAFTCLTGKCIPGRWHCDFDNDCGNGEDEQGCKYPDCNRDQFQCANKRCVSKHYVCDMDNDCRDMSDEQNCTTLNTSCNSWELTCNNGECMSLLAKCNGHWDCSDGSDEANCTTRNTTCASYQFHCRNNRCIVNSWVCDGADDCLDNSDEENCLNTTSTTSPSPHNRTCSSWEMTCRNGYCVNFMDICDGMDDCGDMSDELFCMRTTSAPITCGTNQFTCQSGQCIDRSLRCNNRTGDCWDNSDELDCSYRCQPAYFECYESNSGNEKNCVWGTWVCDGDRDCPHGEDERYCNSTGTEVCPSDYFTCVLGTGCIPPSSRCDGHIDCGDRSDEENCQVNCNRYSSDKDACCQHGCSFLHCPDDFVHGCFTKDVSVGSSCSADHNNLCRNGSVTPVVHHDAAKYFHCPYSEQWILWMLVCNGQDDCNRLGDESYCDRSLMSRRVVVQLLRKTNTSIIVFWSQASSSKYIVSYYPREKPDLWTNRTTTNGHSFTMTGLTPVTTYMISVYPVNGQRVGYPSRPLQVITRAGRPTPPRNVEVNTTLNDGIDRVIVTWQAPARRNGNGVHYTIEMKDLETGYSRTKDTSSLQINFYNLERDHTYNFTVRSVNSEGFISDPVTKKFQYKYDQLRPLNVTVGQVKDTSVTLNWLARAGAKRYNVTAIITYQDGRRITKTTKELSYTFTDLCPQQTIYFTVEADYGNGLASLASDLLTVTTTGTNARVPSIGKITVFNARSVAINITKDPDQNVTLYYLEDSDVDLETFIKKAHRVSTTQQTLTLNDLNACDSYFFRVGSRYDSCPMSGVKTVQTQEDDRAPPKHITSKFLYGHSSPGVTKVQLLWEPPCDTMYTSVRYMVTITWPGTTSGRSELLPPSRNSSLSYLWTNISRGETYHFKIRTNVTSAHFSKDLAVTVPPYSPIEGFVLRLEDNFTVLMNWEAPEDRPPAKIFKGYNVTIMREKKLVESKIVRSPPLKQNVTKGRFVVMISMAVTNGPDGEVFTRSFSYYPTAADNADNPDDDNVVKISKTNLVAILVPVCLVLVILVAVVMIFVVRHRRLQRSFLAFANSHYNTRSGTTTFSSDLDDDEPMIQGFSDDEPLVLA